MQPLRVVEVIVAEPPVHWLVPVYDNTIPVPLESDFAQHITHTTQRRHQHETLVTRDKEKHRKKDRKRSNEREGVREKIYIYIYI